MNITTFAKPGEKNVISPDFERTVTVDGERLQVLLGPSCWVGKSRLAIEVCGKNLGGVFYSRRTFVRSNMSDLERLIKRIKIAPCSKKACKNSYIDEDDLALANPKRLCQRHRLAALNAESAKEEAKQRLKIARLDAQKKSKGYQYKAMVWIHEKECECDDFFVLLYFRNKPNKKELIKASRVRKSQIIGEHSITKL